MQAQLQATSRTGAGVHAKYLWSSLLAFSKSSNGACSASYRVAFASRANHALCFAEGPILYATFSCSMPS
ncbi:hypothetical protein GOP47_0001972 [Adiantum capillus-veneris]|uniref:Uncharacterized protein n=1 Tax=Adiantum capillus-veneris TaxID=13818 RepID=A0A9D4V9G1_ADICA|nr:hypothetical protein GOP47_0001972 [Adiantum capillus-veneris]